MELLTSLARTMGFSFAAGINLYATVAILGLASRYGSYRSIEGQPAASSHLCGSA